MNTYICQICNNKIPAEQIPIGQNGNRKYCKPCGQKLRVERIKASSKGIYLSKVFIQSILEQEVPHGKKRESNTRRNI